MKFTMRIVFAHLLWSTFASAGCYEPNVAHPLPDYDREDPLLRNAFALIDVGLALAVADAEFDTTSFSVEITSSKQTLWSRYHTARERNVSRPDIPQVNGDAVYRIASITKAFTVLGLLYQHEANNLSLDDSIDKYIPELQGEKGGSIPWKDITLRSLASQLSGIPRECLFGFDQRCYSHKNLIDAVTSKQPIFAPNQKSTYSNVAYELIGVAVANVAKQSYESYIEDAIFKPLGMTRSYLSLPPDNVGVIPLGPHYWDIDQGIQKPTGGIYSSSNDLSKFLRYVLTHYNGITSALNWIHSLSPSEGLNSFYGTPWEVFHTDKILSKCQRTVRFITKGGGVPLYTSIIITAPEYDLGFTILVAGNAKLLDKIQEIVTVDAIRGAESVAIQQLQERYTGTYKSTQPELNDSITLLADHRGLVVKEFISNGTDFLKSPLALKLAGLRDGSQPWYLQVVPTLLYRNEEKEQGERWRFTAARERSNEDRGVWDEFCPANVDLPINEVVFWRGNGDEGVTIELPGFKGAKLKRTTNGRTFQYSNEQQDILEL
ncbi:beta-lactamase/transpeptidase-like protein [Dendryphion nanum]|uniref:Beta-lactamase/transpeptidase-like protein n=1 Tax=Dendryphion nanum TaxID=256645 RepID=A0A9P9I866_9PLEO|nr:beta-lactamase/transpeptidase-like protein [Dendryphion nanum]